MESSLVAQWQRVRDFEGFVMGTAELGWRTWNGPPHNNSTELRLADRALLERLRIGTVLGTVLVQASDQRARAGGNSDLILADDFFGAQLPSVKFLVGAAVGAQSRTFE